MCIAICGTATLRRREILRCPIDQCRTECVVSYASSPWWGPIVRCTKCGESWADGELSLRPFARGWRKVAQRLARRQWAEATHGPPPDYSDYFKEAV